MVHERTQHLEHERYELERRQKDLLDKLNIEHSPVREECTFSPPHNIENPWGYGYGYGYGAPPFDEATIFGLGASTFGPGVGVSHILSTPVDDDDDDEDEESDNEEGYESPEDPHAADVARKGKGKRASDSEYDDDDDDE
jgi:hypothetical protein